MSYVQRPRHVALARRFFTSTALAAAMPWVVHAQDVDPAVDELTGERVMESVTVTARRVEESLQDVPITVTSIGGDTLDTFNITSVDKLESRVPSLRFQQGGPNGGATLSLRGISTSNLSPSFESSVALNFDDIFVGQLRILQGGFFDIDQVEVLKGPQSVFFGKSASAGVLTLKSAGPTDEFEAGLRAGYEFEEEGLFAEGFISGPITNTLGGRLAVRYSNTDALVENSFPGVANPERGSEDIYVRSTLEWEPTEKFIASGKFTYIRNERDGANLFADIDCGPNGVADDVALGFITLPAGYDCDVGNGVFAFADPAEALTLDVGLGFPSTNVPFHETDIFLASLKGDYSINDWLNFTSITGYYGLEVLELEAFSFGGILGVGENGLPIQGGTGLGFPNFETDQWTQEFRLSSDTGGFIDFSLGAFYEFRINVADTPLFAANIGLLAPDPVTGFTSDVIKLQDTDSETYSVYASAVVRPTDRITLTGGVRYTNEDKESIIDVPFVHSFLTGPGSFLVEPGFVTQPIEFNDDNISPEATISYRVNDSVNLFAAYKTGFKSGGIDSAVLPTFGLAAADEAGDFSEIIFDSEESEGFEIGIKSDLLDGTLRLNATAYRYVFDDLQIQQFDPVAIQFITLNAGEITNSGLDLEFLWLPPIEGLTFNGSFALLDSEFSDTFFGLGELGDDLDGRDSRFAPTFSGNIGADYRRPIGPLELGLNANVAYSDDYFTADETLTDGIQDSYVTVDAAISLSTPDDRWRLTLSGINLGDELFITSDTGRPFLEAGVGDDRVLNFNRGRQVFLELSYKY